MSSPQLLFVEGFQSSPVLAQIYSNLIERSLYENAINNLFTRLQMSVLEVHFNLNQFNHLFTQLADAIGWDSEQRSLINNLLLRYGFEPIL